MLAPLWMIITGAFMGEVEISQNIGGIFQTSERYANWSLFPTYPTLRPFVELLLDSPEFFHMFWNSTRQTFFIIAGYFIVALPAAYAFARYQFRFKKVLFYLYIILMVMPFQVTMVSNYLVISKLGFMDSELAIILPAIFSTFPVFIMTKFLEGIPASLFEAAQVDGASEFQLYISLGIPLGGPGIVSAVVLGFIDNWNALEQPLIFLKSQFKWPLSLYLPEISAEKAGVAFAASVIAMLPTLLLFLAGQSYLEQGIQLSGIKG